VLKIEQERRVSSQKAVLVVRIAASSGGVPLKIEQVLAQLKKERNKIEKAIAALEPLAREFGVKHKKRSQMQSRPFRAQQATSSSRDEQRKSANIIQFPRCARKVSSGRSSGSNC
jgi:hypothetical protein